MKKIIISVLVIICGVPVYATDIVYENNSYNPSTGTGMCDSGVLQHDSGTVRLRARYEPNQMDIRWYNNNTEITPTNAAANTCNYDGALTLPETQPTRTGYSFAGWRVRPLIDFGTLDLSNGTKAYGKGAYGYSFMCAHSEDSVYWAIGPESFCLKDAEFTELQPGEWKINYDTGTNPGTLYGMIYCSKRPGSYGMVSSIDELKNYSGEDAASAAINCWCKITGWKPQNQTTVYGNISQLMWGYIVQEGNDLACTAWCPYYCAKNFMSGFINRTRLLTPVTNVN